MRPKVKAGALATRRSPLVNVCLFIFQPLRVFPIASTLFFSRPRRVRLLNRRESSMFPRTSFRAGY
jgi:hypothetical protein